MTSKPQFYQSNEDDGILAIQGDLDVYSVADAIRQGCKLIKTNQSFEVIDMEQVGKIDSAGLAFIIEMMKTARKYGKNIQFRNIPARMHDVAKIYGLTQILPDNAFQAG